MSAQPDNIKEALTLLNIHYKSFVDVKAYADKYGHPHPCDTRAWSQILLSALTGIKGIARKKGADLDDGSDVKGANTWGAIDTPRFNGCLKAGTKSHVSNSMASLDGMPHIFFVLWDCEPATNRERCRVWVTSPRTDKIFRKICALWYKKRGNGKIESNNFQLHPPRNKNLNIIRNTCGNLEYPLLFSATRAGKGFKVDKPNPTGGASLVSEGQAADGEGFTVDLYDPVVLTRGRCKKAASS